jgi:hypothetical protein
MSEEIRLKVPAGGVMREFVTTDPKTKKETRERRAIEFVSQGNHVADLAPDSTVTTKSRLFADWLIGELGLEEVEPVNEQASSASPLDAEYDADFPGRKVFISLGIPFETVKGLSREKLIEINGIGPRTADEVLARVANQN